MVRWGQIWWSVKVKWIVGWGCGRWSVEVRRDGQLSSKRMVGWSSSSARLRSLPSVSDYACQVAGRDVVCSPRICLGGSRCVSQYLRTIAPDQNGRAAIHSATLPGRVVLWQTRLVGVTLLLRSRTPWMCLATYHISLGRTLLASKDITAGCGRCERVA